MKTFTLFFLIVLLCTRQVFPQQPKAALFDSHPATYRVPSSSVNNFITSKKGQTVILQLSPQQKIPIQINMNIQLDANTQTVGGSVVGLPGAFLTLTLYRGKAERKFQGELISKSSLHAFTISPDESGNLLFTKLPRHKVMVEN